MIKDTAFKNKIKDIVPGNVRFDEPMAFHTSMGVGGTADVFVTPASVEELKKLITFLVEHGVSFFPVGNCTNLIVRDGGYRGVVVSLIKLETIAVRERRADDTWVYAEAGASLSRLVDLSIRESLSGIEFSAGIPGSVGGALKMNAGAYGREFKDVVTEVSLINGEGVIREIPRDDLRFEYRNLNVADGTVIISALFKLEKGSQGKIRERVSGIIGLRKKKHPLRYRSAGSVFKNPEGTPAGQIIDDVGLKGFQVGDAKISDIHGNFIVNLGKARAREITHLIDLVQKRVLDEKGVSLELEIKVIGEE